MSPQQHRQAGLTLIEILVALAITSFLIIGLFTIVQTTLQASANQGSLSRFQDNERLAMQRIGDVVQQAGYFTGPLANSASSVLPAAALTLSSPVQAIAFASGQGIVGTHVSAMPQDSITARYYAGAADSLINCDGSTVAATGVYYNTFAIVGGNLQCTLSTTIGGTTTIGTPVTLVAGVEDMVIQYAVSSTASCGASYSSATNPVDTYYRTAAMSGSGWCGVVSVQLSLLFDNPLYNASGPASQQWPQQNPFVQLTRLVNIMNRI